jgi:CHAD domain-containing protein
MRVKGDDGYRVYGAIVISRQLVALQQEINGVREGKDIEAVHRMRVASRRLRAALPLFRECLPGKKYPTWLKRVRSITRDLASARDTDVQLDALRKFYQSLPDPHYRPGVRRLSLRLRQRRAKIQVRVLKDLDRLEASRTLEDMSTYLAPLLARQHQTYLYTPYIYQRAFEAISGSLEAFLSFDAYVSQPERVAELHAMRIAAKKLRYTMEAFASIYAGELKEHLQVLRKVQEALGDIHDYDVWKIALPLFIEEETQRSLDYFGHTRAMRRIEPGIQFYQQTVQENRDRSYQDFVPYWQGLQARGIWESLNQTIQAPYHAYEETLRPEEPIQGEAGV